MVIGVGRAVKRDEGAGAASGSLLRGRNRQRLDAHSGGRSMRKVGLKGGRIRVGGQHDRAHRNRCAGPEG